MGSRFPQLALALLAACGGGASTERPASPPARLADTGLYADFESKRVAPDVLPYSPQYPLWSDGAAKRRWIRLPEGAAIDASDPEAWRFPVGTQLWKEFAFDRRVETRYLELGADGEWRFASYVWSADEREAALAPDGGLRGACESAPGVPYDVPALADCRTCHGAEAARPLGFDALQLSPDRDPLAPHAEPPPPGAVDLRGLSERGLLRGLPAAQLDTPPRVGARTPRERAALGYLATNCGSCHDGAGLLAPLALSFRAPLAEVGGGRAPALATALERATAFRFPGEPSPAPPRIAGGAPERSALYRRMASRDPLVQMPPIGTHAPDAAALDLIGAWIREELAAAPTASLSTFPTSDTETPR